ncbi:GNAT family N-acetyltransferase [Streptomyces sp. NPDC088729]|uniref:GNAT family N-acetyltransferase n=1 Tax=Streptomyces sp. NPDC088729 TaxID=3365876 RepID=UPI00381678E2
MERDRAVSDMDARPLSGESVAAWSRLREETERVDRTGAHVGATDLAEILAAPKLDARQDTLGLWDGPRLAAYAVLHTPHGAVDVARFQGDAAVHPEWRRHGLGTRLVEWLEERARAQHAAERELSALPGELLLEGKAGDGNLLRLTEKLGYTPCRWWFDMKRPVGDAPAGSPADRDGTRPIPYEAVYDEAARLAHNDAFRDHWNFVPMDPADWRTWVTGTESFRPALSRLLMAGDEVAAYLIAHESEAETAATGRRDCHVSLLGTRRARRGRGSAQALLTDVLHAASDAGYDTVSLVVDTDNPSGALGIYENAGFAVDRKSVTYARPLNGPGRT